MTQKITIPRPSLGSTVLTLLFITILMSCQTSRSSRIAQDQKIVQTDIHNFWKAYDAISAEKDSTRQSQLLDEIFIQPASEGQKALFEVRRYTKEDYLTSINQYSHFWNSLRPLTNNLDSQIETLRSGTEKLASVYPDIRPSSIYFTMGTHRTPGTGFDSLVLIGTEYALGDTSIQSEGMPVHITNYYKVNPIDHLEFLTIHEYVHTQQKEMAHNLLCLSLYEGIPDFVAEVATQNKSPFDAMTYGPKNDQKIKERFIQDMYKPNSQFNWLWNSKDNEFGTRDLGYYVGHTIASRYYNKAEDKTLALKQLIEIDYTNDQNVEMIVDGSGYFEQSLDTLYARYESSRPRILKIEGIENESDQLQPGTKTVTIHFSQPMDVNHRGFDYGPLGEDHVMAIQTLHGFSDDKKSISFDVKLKPDHRHQMMITTRFRSAEGIPLKQLLLNVKTQ